MCRKNDGMKSNSGWLNISIISFHGKTSPVLLTFFMGYKFAIHVVSLEKVGDWIKFLNKESLKDISIVFNGQ